MEPAQAEQACFKDSEYVLHETFKKGHKSTSYAAQQVLSD